MKNYTHTPVLLEECLKQIEGMQTPLRNYLDLTLGRGGHAFEILERYEELHLVGVDQDDEALSITKIMFESENLLSRVDLHKCNFHSWPEYMQKNNVDIEFDLILIDLGVSSPQLDDSSRGFSFYNDGPLDMRMNQSQELTAAQIVNDYSENELTRIFKDLGEIYNPKRVVAEILNHRSHSPFETTLELAKLIEAKEGWRKKGSHPATRFFLALRMEVNNELNGLEDSLPEIMKLLSHRGRLLVITFHSLEDRIVKNTFKHSDIGAPLFKKVIKPTREEIMSNPRSRSSLLRVFEKGASNEKKKKY